MLFHLAMWLKDHVPALRWMNVVRYTSTRIILATLTALVISFLLSPWFIRLLKQKTIGQVVRDDGPQSHFSKKGTPTMGGALILFALTLPTLLWCDLRNSLIWLALVVTLGYGLVGFLDDYLKISKKNPKGLPGRYKMLGQYVIGGVAIGLLYYWPDLVEPSLRGRLALPFTDFYKYPINLPVWLYAVFALFVVVGSSNAVNLTDGLDGLAIGPVIMASGALLILAYGAGTVFYGVNIATYLKIPFLRGTGELAVFCGAMAGAGIGFLWYNTFPASVFMGDVGALALGGALGIVAVMTKNEFTLAVIGGVFVVEALSVMIQVGSFKLTGKRVFKMAPIHHHFELKGWPEPKVIVRFWIISFMLALAGLATLKLR